MIRRFYVHNFRCLENFELPPIKGSSALLIGKNGTGKTSLGLALELLQKIARGTSRVGDLVRPKDFTLGRTKVPMRFVLEVDLKEKVYKYEVAFEFPDGFQESRVLEEKLTVNGVAVFSREVAQVRTYKVGRESEAMFRIDWHLLALPIVQQPSSNDQISYFKEWLANTLILRPVPSLIKGESDSETLQPNPSVANYAAWFSGLLASSPSSYTKIDKYLKHVMPDLQALENPAFSKDFRNLILHFSKHEQSVRLSFDDLSDGEKCFMIYALTIAANGAQTPLLCFWDEPDNFLAPSEVGASVMALRRAFRDFGQLIVTSHNPEAIRHFSDENTFQLARNSHFEPTIIRSVAELRESGELRGNFIDAIVNDSVTP